MHKPRMELPGPDMFDMLLVVEYGGHWQIVERRHPTAGETVLAYRPIVGRTLVGRYDGRSVSDGSETWTEAIVRGVVITTLPMTAGNGKGAATEIETR